ncbi:LysR family transcriptional regulator [Cysteiniphilum halobium]|uniref:LysR family transcriptional regulator n=1 Tax=Cysteiniphilum halobium TaxID=2219059 RepID=UPI0013C2FADC|nr:LysR family transcriptional regulator [Cysteiniphilum halobium]
MRVDQLNLNLLRTLHVLLDKKSVTIASIKLFRTQPAVSNSLKQLREIFQDPLLLPNKTETGFVLTEKAKQIQSQLHHIMHKIDHLLQPNTLFNPKEINLEISIGIQEHIDKAFIDLLYQQIKELPKIKINLHRITSLDSINKSKLQSFDFLIGSFSSIPSNFSRELYFKDTYICLSGNQNLNKQMTISVNDLNKYEHVAISYSSNIANTIIENSLQSFGIQRKYRLIVSNIEMLGSIILDYNLLCITMFKSAAAFTNLVNLKIFNLPFITPEIDIHLLHQDLTLSPQKSWFKHNILNEISKLFLNTTK